MQSILSGPIALLGTSSRNSLMIEQDRINAAGGFLGRQIEFVFRDSKGQPQEAARIARELVNSTGCELLVDSEASSGAFAVQEVVRDLGNVVCIHTNSETSSLTADPKIRAPTAFRVARQGVHDAVAGSIYLAEFAKAKKLNKWATCSPDYAYGRDTTAQYLQFLKQFNPDIEVITDAWPKLGQPDFTEVITKLIQAKPQALFTLLYAGDLSAFVNQGNVYALFSQMTVATPNVDYPVMAAIKNLPPGIQSATRYLETFPGYARQQGMGPGLPQAMERAADQLVVAMHGGDAVLRGGHQEGRLRSTAKALAAGAHRHEDQYAVRRRRHHHHARGSHHDRLRHRLGPDHAEGAVPGGHQARRLGQDHRARDGVEEAAEVHLSFRWTSTRSAPASRRQPAWSPRPPAG